MCTELGNPPTQALQAQGSSAGTCKGHRPAHSHLLLMSLLSLHTRSTSQLLQVLLSAGLQEGNSGQGVHPGLSSEPAHTGETSEQRPREVTTHKDFQRAFKVLSTHSRVCRITPPAPAGETSGFGFEADVVLNGKQVTSTPLQDKLPPFTSSPAKASEQSLKSRQLL